MFSFIFFFLFLVVFLIIAIGGSIIRGILSLLFGRRAPYQHTTQGAHGQSQTNSHRGSTAGSAQQSSSKKREKIFDDSEGEYVDFEEIQD